MARMRLTPTMIELLVSMLKRTDYPADHNNGRTFKTLEEHGLIQCDFYGIWGLTDDGRKLALKLLKR